MKFVCCIVCVLITAVSSLDIRQQLRDITAECRQGADDESITALSPDDMACLGACYLENVGLMDGDNKLVPDKINSLMDPISKSKNGKMFKEVSAGIIKKCESLTDKDKCVAAVLIVGCLYDETRKLGFAPDLLY